MLPFIILALALSLFAACCLLIWHYSGIIIHPRREPVTSFPGFFGLDYEEVSFKAQDGLMCSGWWVPAAGQTSDKTIILCHGWGTNKGDILQATWKLAREGFNLLYFDFRGHGASETKGPSSLGYLEQKDLRGAINFINQAKVQSSRSMAIYGLSMGASVSFCIGSSSDAKAVSAIVCESPFASAKEAVWRYARLNFDFPKFPLLDIVFKVISFRAGNIDHEAHAPVSVARDFNVPRLMMIYAEADELCPPKDGELIASAMKKDIHVETWICPNAGHAQCFSENPVEFHEKLSSFFKKYVK
ncbi:alpha/beta hydrolase [Elusimicrobiota bacterium]